MNLALLLPAGLAALAALLLPLLVHLARRGETRLTDFAALRWLAGKPRPRRRLRFDERLLLALRLLLLAALALLLAQPVLLGRPDRTPWIVAAPGVPAAAVRDAAGGGEARLRWLAPGFPPLDAQAPSAQQPLASLLRELDATLPAGAPLTVLVPEVIDGADAQRPRLSRAVTWQVAPGAAAPTADPIVAAAAAAPSLALRHAPDAPGLRFLRAVDVAWRAADNAGANSAPSRPDDAGEDNGKRGDRAPNARDAVTARTASVAPPRSEAATALDIGDIAKPLPAGTRALAWLAPGPLPAAVRDWIRAGGRALLSSDAAAPELRVAAPLWRDDAGGALVEGVALGRGRLMRFTRPLTPAAMPQLLEPDFPARLRALFEDPPPAPARVAARDYAPTTGLAPFPETPRPLAPWLVALVAALFALERWLASGPRRGNAR